MQHMLTLRSTPIALSYHEAAAHRLGVHLTVLVHDGLLRLHYRASFAFIVDSNNRITQLKFLARTRRR